jgi:hypothetical protein
MTLIGAEQYWSGKRDSGEKKWLILPGKAS